MLINVTLIKNHVTEKSIYLQIEGYLNEKNYSTCISQASEETISQLIDSVDRPCFNWYG